MRWIKDSDFVRGDVPMTKFDARIITIAMLEIKAGDVFLDIGAGTGSISVEAALQGAEVYAIEKELEAVEIITQNKQRFNVDIALQLTQAPDGIEKMPAVDKIFIGGSGESLKDIFYAAHLKLRSQGIMVANFITLKNLTIFSNLLKDFNYKQLETRLIQSSVVSEKTGLLKANNPIFIVKGVKN